MPWDEDFEIISPITTIETIARKRSASNIRLPAARTGAAAEKSDFRPSIIMILPGK